MEKEVYIVQVDEIGVGTIELKEFTSFYDAIMYRDKIRKNFDHLWAKIIDWD